MISSSSILNSPKAHVECCVERLTRTEGTSHEFLSINSGVYERESVDVHGSEQNLYCVKTLLFRQFPQRRPCLHIIHMREIL